MRSPRFVVAALAVLAALGWHSLGRTGRPAAALPSVAPPAASGDRLIVEPDDGMAPIYALLSSPRRSLDLTMYELDDPTAEQILASDAGRGVRVRVILDRRLERVRNQPAYDYLSRRGAHVAWSSPRYFATHEKAFVIDGRTAVIMSLNLTARYYATSRDAAVVDVDRVDVAAIESVFTADLRGQGAVPPADDLVWSPGQSWADVLAMIGRARSSVALESEELTSPAVVSALLAAARRGVQVSVAMTYSDKWRPAFAALTRVGARIRVMYGERPLYLHAKLIAVDAGRPGGMAFVGSENLSDASLLHDRELGLVLLAPRLVQRVAAVIGSDESDGSAWPPPL
ncbi:MAG TPA: phospholipase D-like domain-containing protein [Mycobacteriales bacterium]|nr:phospholipase D-like domain-containing protein [Mycobacteriales bacterium]